jgi:hypothetical protein
MEIKLQVYEIKMTYARLLFYKTKVLQLEFLLI